MDSNLIEIGDRKVLKLDNKFIEAKLDLKTAEELKIFGIVVAQIDTEDEDFKAYEIKIKELEALTGKKKNEKQLKQLADKMLRKTFYIYDEYGWTGWTLFNKIRYIRNEAKIIISFHPDLKPYLLKLKNNFTKINLLNYINLQSGYAMKLYLLLKQYQTIGKRKFDIDKLKEILQTPKSYKDFRSFKIKVLNIAKKEINTKTDLEIEWEITKKARKKVTEIEFTIKSTGVGQKEETEIKIISNNVVPKTIDDLVEINDFKLFRAKVIGEYSTKVLVLDNNIFTIKGTYLEINNELLKASEALKQWDLLFKNKNEIKIFDSINKMEEFIKQKIFYKVAEDNDLEKVEDFKIVEVKKIDSNLLNVVLKSVTGDFMFTVKKPLVKFIKYNKFKLNLKQKSFAFLE